MATNVVGSVTAELVLDSAGFVTGLEEAKTQIKGLGNSFNGNNAQKMAQDIAKLEEQLQKNAEVIEKQKKTIDSLKGKYNSVKGELDNLKMGFERANRNINSFKEEVKATQSTLDGLDASTKKGGNSLINLGTNFSEAGSSAKKGAEGVRFFNEELSKLNANTVKNGLKSLQAQLNSFGGNLNYEKYFNWNQAFKGTSELVLSGIAGAGSEYRSIMSQYYSLTNEYMTRIGEAWNKLTSNAKESNNVLAQMSSEYVTQFDKIRMALEQGVTGFANFSEASRTAFLEVEHSAKKGLTAVENFHNNIQRKSNLANTYKALSSSLSEVISYLDRVAQKEQQINNQRVAEKQAEVWRKGASAVEKYHAQIQKLIEIENQLSSTGSRISSVLNNSSGAITRQKEAVTQLKQAHLSTNESLVKFAEAQARLGNSLMTTNPKFAEQLQYLQRLKNQNDQTSASASKLGASTKSASAGMNTLTGATNKLQGALSSVKMMATALSSMFIWTFGMSLYQATKQTLESKNEMESYLQQMHMGRGAINLFNQGLDETADRFKKLNKYMIGETIASIGMEFDLTANQMKKSMEVVAMVQNEYVRAGRKESEASLAVKDILQGEFLRLSRETGVGKQDLIDTGLWQGDLKDVEGLMDALKKVGEDRHWDLFASKCLSLNDVISETKNRISEFGASLADQFSPAIVNAFNMIVGAIDRVTNTWDNFDPTQKIIVGTTSFIAFGTALLMVAGNLSLLDIATMGYSKSILTTILKLDVATVKEYGLMTAISSKITAIEADTVANMGNIKSIASRILGLEAETVAEHGLSGALALSATVKGEDTVATNLNALSKDTNVASTLMNAQVVGEFTVIEGLSTVALDKNTTATELNAVIKELKARADLTGFQAIVVYVTGLKAEEVQAMSTNEALLALLGTMTAIKAIALAVVLVGIAIALGSLAMEAQRAKEAVDGFYDIVDNGDAYLEDAQKNVESLEEQYNNLANSIAEAKAKGEDTWKLEQNQAQTQANLDVAKKNLEDIQNTNNNAKRSAEEFNNQILNANTDFERKNAEIFEKLGEKGNKATELASNYTQQYLKGMEQMRKATKAYTDELDAGSKHIDENTTSLQNMGAESKTVIQYAQDYGEEVLKNAQYQKEWAEGDFWAIFKIGLSDLKLAWIDFTYWLGQQDWWKDFCNALGEMQNALGDFYNAIKPALPYVGELLKLLGSALWTHFVQVCYGIYEIVKLVYPWFKKWAEIKYNEIKFLVSKLYELSQWVEEKGKIVTDWFDNFSKKDDMGKALDIVDVLLSFGGIGAIKGLIGSSFEEITLEDVALWLFPNGALDLGDIFNDNIQIDWDISQFVNMYIVEPFKMALWSGIKTIPIVGDIISLLESLSDGQASGSASQKGSDLASAFGTAFENFIRNIPVVGDILAILGLIGGTAPQAHNEGHAVGSNVKQGVNDGKQGTAQTIRDEVGEIISALANRVGEAYAKAQAIGSAILTGINSIIQHHSPGIPAQLIDAEMGEIVLAMDNAYNKVYTSAQGIGQAITTGIQPTGEFSFDADAVAQYQSNTALAVGMADETVVSTESAFSDLDFNTMTTFASIGNTVGSTMTNIASDTRLNYTNIANTTKTQLANMQSQTTKNIGAIKQSWTGMQTALIQSAEHIRSETGAKINSLQNNMATFWRKVQNPALLLGAGNSSEEKSVKSRRYGSRGSGVRKILQPKGYAGSMTSSRSPLKVAPNSPLQGISSISADKFNDLLKGFKDKRFSSTTPMNALFDYLMCLINGNGECVAGKKCGYAGGWDFNWSDDIKRALLQWHTHFGEIYDPYLYVGKFENDNFPIRGIAPIARNYIYDAISRTQYEYYFDSKYGDPLSIWNAGHFNCYDGAILVMALARSLGFPNSTMVHGSWGGTPHVWARIAGLGDIDATAIQGGYGFTAPSRTGAGSPAISRFKHNKTPSSDNGGKGDIHIHIDMSGATVTDDSIGERIGKKVRGEIIDLINPSPSTGY